MIVFLRWDAVANVHARALVGLALATILICQLCSSSQSYFGGTTQQKQVLSNHLLPGRPLLSGEELKVPSGKDADGERSNSNKSLISSQVLENSQMIAQTISQLSLVPGRLLVYDPGQDAFLLFTVAPKSDPEMMRWHPCPRCSTELLLLVQALLDAQPQRFTTDGDIFQHFFTDSDLTYTQCAGSHSCAFSTPWLHFGSFFRNTSILPMVRPLPHHEYLRCIREWVLQAQQRKEGNATSSASTKRERSTNTTEEGSCTAWVLFYDDNVEWNNLTPVVVWRGSDYDFLPTIEQNLFTGNSSKQNTTLYSVPRLPFRPRRVAVEMSSTMPSWLDIKFTTSATENRLALGDLSKFRYHIDLGGAGGTTWRGTLEKLAMPGLLFHHETPSQDWFYDELLPWKHYVPIRTDLSNLQEQFEWAESNPEKAQEIARQGTIFARHLFSYRRLHQEYQRYFGEPSSILHQVLNAYSGPNTRNNESLASLLSTYESDYNISYVKTASCTREFCDIRTNFHSSTRHFLRNATCKFISARRRSRIGRSCSV